MSDTPTQIIKLIYSKLSNLFLKLIYKHFNYCIDKDEFPNDLKHADIVPEKVKKKTIDLYACFQTSLKFMKS